MAPLHFWWLGPLSLGLYFYLLHERAGAGLLTGWLFGLGLYGTGTSWIYVSIHQHGGAAPALAGFLVALFAAGMALFPMLQGWLFTRLRSAGPGRSAVAFALTYLLMEWLLTWFLTGFPWLAAGYGQLESPLAALAPVGGVALVSFATVCSGLALALIVMCLRAQGLAAPGRLAMLTGVLLAPWILGALAGQIRWTEPGPLRTAALVQGNVAQATKWNAENRRPIVQRYRALTGPHWGADLILWPEAAITVFEHQAEALLEVLDAEARTAGSSLILGIPSVRAYPGGDYAFLNAAVGLGMAEGRYVKRRLVPFGEYVPLEGLLRGLIRFFDLPMSHAEAGAWQQPPFRLGGGATPALASMAICYEIVYPQLVRGQADVLLTISNDTWFGDSIGPQQHLAIARMRALENGRWLLRSTNNGITAIVDASGQVRGRLPQFEAGVLAGEYREMHGRTPFNRFGPWPLYVVLLLAAAVLAFRKAGK